MSVKGGGRRPPVAVDITADLAKIAKRGLDKLEADAAARQAGAARALAKRSPPKRSPREPAPHNAAVPFAFAMRFRREDEAQLEQWIVRIKAAATVVTRLCRAGVKPIGVDVDDWQVFGGTFARVHVPDAAEARLRLFGAGRMPALEERDRTIGFELRGVWIHGGGSR